MKSDLAKVLFDLEGRPLIEYVLEAVREAGFDRTVVVVGHQADRVRAALRGEDVSFALQEPQLGTGHAMQCAAPYLEDFTGDLVVLAGDAPLVRASTLRRMMEHHRRTAATVTVLTARLPDPSGYGRMVREESGRISAIVEDKDCTREQKAIDEINSSIYAFRYSFLARSLPTLAADNEQGELYLTDTVAMAFEEGEPVEGIVVDDYREVLGINTRAQLEEAARVLQERDDV